MCSLTFCRLLRIRNSFCRFSECGSWKDFHPHFYNTSRCLFYSSRRRAFFSFWFRISYKGNNCRLKNISLRRQFRFDKMAAQNLNIIRKWSLSILKPAEFSRHKLSMRKKRFVVSLRPIKYLEELLEA